MATKKKAEDSIKKKPPLLNDDDRKFLESYINNPSPTGFEAEGQKLWLNYLRSVIDTHQVDTYGTVFGVINPSAKFKVVIEAHADEISWFVSYITDNGLIYVRRNGGSDHQIAPSKKVWIHTRDGKKIPAVFGWPAIHTRKDSKEQSPEIKNIFLDMGCTKKEEVLKSGVHP